MDLQLSAFTEFLGYTTVNEGNNIYKIQISGWSTKIIHMTEVNLWELVK